MRIYRSPLDVTRQRDETRGLRDRTCEFKKKKNKKTDRENSSRSFIFVIAREYWCKHVKYIQRLSKVRLTREPYNPEREREGEYEMRDIAMNLT